MDDILTPDPLIDGAKGLVFVGDQIIVYRRDTRTDTYPLYLDLPGGGTEKGESPFETFKREVKEEFGLDLTPDDIVYARRYPSTLKSSRLGYYLVAKLPEAAAARIKFGDEGTEYFLMAPEAYLDRDDAWPVFQERTADYLKSLRD
jgi:8-oxo-dGTP diphosphatase